MILSPDRVGREVIRRRILAYVADAFVVVGAVAVALRTSTSERSTAWRIAVGMAVSGLVAIPYHVLLEGTTGQTLGKKLFRVTVVGEGGEPCTYRRATIRTVFRVVDWLPAAYLAGLTAMVITGRRRRLGDFAAGTVVVREDELTGARGRSGRGEDACT